MTLTTAYLLGRDLDAAYRSILAGDYAFVTAPLDSARERLERAVVDGVKDYEEAFVAYIRTEIKSYAAHAAALKETT